MDRGHPSKRRRPTKWFGLGAMAVCCLCVAAVGLRSVSLQDTQPAATRTPFLLVYVETSGMPGSETPAQRTVYYAERGDGAIAYGVQGTPPGRREVVNLPEKWRVVLSDPLKLKTTYDYALRMPDVHVRPLRDDCNPEPRQTTPLGVDIIAGYPAYHYQHMLGLGDGTTLDQHYWFSRDLGCFDIQRIVYRRDARGAVTGVFERRVVEVTRGEPDASFFTVPADYREVLPSEFEEAMARNRMGADTGSNEAGRVVLPSCLTEALAARDRYYRDLGRRVR